MARATYGTQVKQRSRRLLQSIVGFALGELEGCDRVKVSCSWVSDEVLRVHTTLRDLVELTTRDDLGEALKKPQVAEALNRMKDFLEILVDERVHDQGSEDWLFTLKLWSRDIPENLRSFEMEWENRRSPQSKAVTAAIGGLQTSGLKPGVPMPKFKPVVWVDRPKPLQEVKDLLLGMMEQTLSIAAVYGLGGIGKSVLAQVLIEDAEVQQNFPDGILWKTLGQNPDLQNCLGDWIRELDKSRDSFSATTLESASGYLHNLLAERRMLLVVDDVWNAAHAEWFRVGGAGCRVLVTTRAAYIPGAVRYDLALMSPDEALKLMQNELGHQWTAEMEKPAREFSKSLGYLPLALKLMAVQVGRGRSWENLRKAFFEERVRLRMLDQPGVKLADLSEEKQRDYSLRACLQLSLRWLEPEQLSNFTWLGVLPEDATIRQGMAIVLWDVADWEAEEGLLALYESSLLSRGADTWNGESTYRVHDLLHVLAKELIEQPRSIVGKDSLVGLGLSFADAQAQFLERYRGRSVDESWYGLANDGYVHRHLTWHLEMAGRCDEVHELMASGEDQNDWFEACDKIGQPGIFVEDVRRGWRLAEELYETDRGQAIVLQCRYALITGTLNSLLENLPAEMMAEFVKRGFWSIEQAWAYVEQMQDEYKVATAIEVLAVYLTKPLFEVAVEKARSMEDYRELVLKNLAKIDSADFSETSEAARSIQDESKCAGVLGDLAKIDSANFSERLEAAQPIQSESGRAEVLCDLAETDLADFSEALETARSIQDESKRAEVLSALAQIDIADFSQLATFSQLLEAARSIQDEQWRAEVLRALAQIDLAYFSEALEAARSIQDDSGRARALCALAQINSADFSQRLEVVQLIQNEYWCVEVLSDLAQIDFAYFSEALEAARLIQDECNREEVLRKLAKIDSADFSQRLEAGRSIQSESGRAEVLLALAQIDSAYFSEALKAARLIQDMYKREQVLSKLAQIDSADFSQLLEAARSIEDEYDRAEVLSKLAQIDLAYFSEALEAARSIQSESKRTGVLSELAQIDSADFSQRLEAAQSIEDKDDRVKALSALAQVDSADFSQRLEAARSIQDEDDRIKALSALAQVDSADFSQRLEAAQSIQDEDDRVEALIALAQVDSANSSQRLEVARSISNRYYYASVLIAQIDSTYFSKALEAARLIQNESSRAWILGELAQIDSADFSQLLEAARLIQDEYDRACILRDLAKIDSVYFSEALEVARLIQDEYDRAEVLLALAQIDSAYFSEALKAARLIQSESKREQVLIALAQIDSADFSQLLEAGRSIQSESGRAEVLLALAQIDSAYFSEALKAARLIQDEDDRRSESKRNQVLIALAQIDSADFSQLLEVARSIENEYDRACILIALAQIDSADFSQLLEVARSIEDEQWRAEVLRDLAQIDSAYFSEALEAARSIQYDPGRAEVLRDLAQIDSAYFSEALEALQLMSQCELPWHRWYGDYAKVLRDLAQIDSADFSQLFESVRSLEIEDEDEDEDEGESTRAWVLSQLANSAPKTFLPYIHLIALTRNITEPNILSSYLPFFPLANLPYTDWQTYLHLLAHRTRADLMGDLATLYPAILHLGGEDAGQRMVGEMGRVCKQWK